MNNKIKQTVDDLISFGEVKDGLKYLKKAEKIIGFSDLYSLIRYLLHWQKHLINDKIAPFHLFKKDKLILDDTNQMGYSQLFELAPELKAIYKLDEFELAFNKNLSKTEVNEILSYIDQNYKVTIRKKRRTK